MSLLNCPARQRRPLSPDNPTERRTERAAELFVTCQITCYKWGTTLLADELRRETQSMPMNIQNSERRERERGAWQCKRRNFSSSQVFRGSWRRSAKATFCVALRFLRYSSGYAFPKSSSFFAWNVISGKSGFVRRQVLHSNREKRQ